MLLAHADMLHGTRMKTLIEASYVCICTYTPFKYSFLMVN